MGGKIHTLGKCRLMFNIGEKFPKIEISGTAKIFPIRIFHRGELKKFLDSTEKEFEFYPTEPDYSFRIQRFVEGKFKKTTTFDVEIPAGLVRYC